MLRITKSTEPITIEQLILSIYSPPGIGKTSLGFTANKPLLLDFDGGAYRSGNRGDIVPINSWADVADIKGEDLAGYQTLVIDTAGRALDTLTTDIIKSNPKMGRSGGALTLQGYGELKSRFISFTKLVRSFGLDIVLLAHSDEQRGNGDDLIERIDVQGGSKNEIYKAADVMGRLRIVNGKRYLNFSPTDTQFGKNPAGLAELPVPAFTDEPNFLGDVISQIKNTLNKLTASQQLAANTIAEWQEKFAIVTTPKELNALFPAIAELDLSVRENVGRLSVKHGKAKGWEWDTAAKKFKVTETLATADQKDVETNGNGHKNGFNPIASGDSDRLTKIQTKDITTFAKKLKVDADNAASLLFEASVTVDQLSQEAASRMIADMKAQVEGA
jgi:hypothetical protein